MAYKLHFDRKVIKDFKRITPSNQKKIIEKIEAHLFQNPGLDKQLKGKFKHLYSYRVGTYRVIYEIKNDMMIVLRISHRKKAYK